nr:MAG: glutamyl-tRNA and/or aspartyl-tRNA amidotransferase, C subunit [Candidatus Nanosalinarum sp. J07AB56]
MEKEKVRKVSDNARIDLTDDEVEDLSEDLDTVLEKFSVLQDVDVEDVDPAFHPVEMEEETREDRKSSTLTQEEALSNADNTEQGYFKGPSA